MATTKRTKKSRSRAIYSRAPINQPRPDEIAVNASCRASMEEIAALGPARCFAFLNGIANVVSVLNPQTPVGGHDIRERR